MSRASVVQGAVQLFEAGRHEEAKQTLRRHLQRVPGDGAALKMLAMIHGALHEDDESFAMISRATMIAPRDAEAWFMMGNVATILRKYKDGARAYAEALRLNPDNPQAYDGLARCTLSLGDYDKAVATYEQAIARWPDSNDMYHRMGTSLALLGRMDEAIAVARRGLARLPNDAVLQEFIVYYENFADGVDPVRHRDAHARLCAMWWPVRAPARAFPNSRDPERPLRVAFLSQDFYFHACAFFLEGPLRALDRARVIPYLYAHPAKHDEFTRRFHALGTWRDVSEMSGEQVVALAASDAIDVLVDCSAWTERKNLDICSRRAAPIQITYLGYPNTTGLPEMDYRIVDPWTDPPGSEAHCTERLLRLPQCFLCFQPPEGTPGFDPAPPCGQSGPVTFGTFNRTMKIGPRAVETWARILREVPDSRLLIKIQIASDEVAPNFISKFERLGVARDRIITTEWLRRPGEHFPMYRRMDIALDSFPYNGTTTTCEALWMGVPVVALAGDSHRSRVGVSLLNAVGVPELLAATPEEYAEVAIRLAGDRERIARYHRTLRDRMAQSALTDAGRMARQFEAAIRGVWREWCRAPR